MGMVMDFGIQALGKLVFHIVALAPVGGLFVFLLTSNICSAPKMATSCVI